MALQEIATLAVIKQQDRKMPEDSVTFFEFLRFTRLNPRSNRENGFTLLQTEFTRFPVYTPAILDKNPEIVCISPYMGRKLQKSIVFFHASATIIFIDYPNYR